MHLTRATAAALAVAGTVALGVPLAQAVRAALPARRFCPVRLVMAKAAAQRAAAVGLAVRVEAVLDLAALPALLAPRAGVRPARAQAARGS